MKYTELFQNLGLAKNEAKIYEVLLENGEQGVGVISEKSGVHRRNVYDSLQRLMEKGLVIEIIESAENKYQAVEPKKLLEIIQEKADSIEKILPELEKLQFNTPTEYRVHTYRGKEGWKQYIRDIINTGEDFYSIGAKGGWLDPRVQSFLPSFLDQLKKKNIKTHHLFDQEAKTQNHPILKAVDRDYKFLPKKYSTTSGIDIFGDHVNILHNLFLGQIGTEEEIMFTVIVNKNLADSYRTWFKFMWDSCDKN
ncbi:MAG: helix-turn-helix domain-containing protein [Patescibacteria group bacterium]